MTREEELDVRVLASRVRERIYYLALVDIATHHYHGEDDYGDIAREALETADALEAQASNSTSQTTPASSEPQTAASEAINIPDGWIEWLGGKCPAGQKDVVSFLRRSGERVDGVGNPDAFNWGRYDRHMPSDIIAYHIDFNEAAWRSKQVSERSAASPRSG